MDTSETYIKMCDCAEIQDIAKAQNFDSPGNFFADNRTYCWWFCCDCGTFADAKPNDSIIWLPRQDQLQEMAQSLHPAYSHWHILCGFTHWVYPSCIADKDGFRASRNIPLEQFTSMEQLWLAFVMQEKYNKLWDGKDWQSIEP